MWLRISYERVFFFTDHTIEGLNKCVSTYNNCADENYCNNLKESLFIIQEVMFKFRQKIKGGLNDKQRVRVRIEHL